MASEIDRFEVPTEQRLSVLAVLSLALALLGIVTCVTGVFASGSAPRLAIVVMASPGLGLLAGVLGFVALRSIGRSRGAILGRPLALIGLFVGLSSAVLQGAVVIGAVRTWADTRRTLVPVAEAFVVALEEDRLADARRMLSPGAGESLSRDEQLLGFRDALRGAGGPAIGATLHLMDVLSAAGELRRRSRGAAPGAVIPDVDARPVQLVLRDGPVLAYIFLDASALEAGDVLIADALVLPAGATEAITLLEDGPASQLARAIGIAVRSPEPG